jgi:drug/metabolite transporter (DMT)-like permease
LAALSYAAGIVFVPYAYRAGVSPGTGTFLRYALAVVALVPFLVVSGRWVKLPRPQALALFLLGLGGYTAMGVSWYLALSMTPAWLVSLLVALYPLPIHIGTWLLLREAVETRQVLALMSVLAGGVALFWRPFEGASVPGVVLMLTNVMAYTLLVLVGQRWRQGSPATVTTSWMMLGAVVGTFFYALLSKQLSFQFAPIGWTWVLSSAVISTAVSHTLVWRGVELIGPSRAAIIGSLEPLFSILLSVLILRERMSSLQLLGGTLILLGVFVVQLGPRQLVDER